MTAKIPLLREAALALTSRVYVVSGNSMAPTIRAGDYLLVSVRAYRANTPNRGDLVIVRDPRDSGLRYLKRVIGLPGETVRLGDGMLCIDGVHLSEPYLGGLPASPGLDSTGWGLGNTEFFVLGDNRSHSTDSREFGPVDSTAILGKAWVRYWPLSRWAVFQ